MTFGASGGSGMVHYRILALCRVPETLGKGRNTLGKSIDECSTRQSPHSEASDGEGDFAKCRFSGTRQKGWREPNGTRQKLHVGAAVMETLPNA